jgi:CheY-like chemotaxis protein
MRKTILIIDDDYSLLRLTQMILDRIGYSSIVAASVNQAREILIRESSVDLIILDLMMPDEDGLSFIKWLENDSNITPNIPIILNTAKNLSESEYDIFKEHCHKIILKGMNFTETLISEVSSVLT